ncbi:MAG: SEC-C domain-containing protein [Chloroflexi bacterium]|nr:SEC-C domain-containing protein [Chloroflexota bacterium]
MFQDLYRRIRSQVVSYVFTYQYRGFAKLEEEDRDRASRKAIETAKPVSSEQPKAQVPSPKSPVPSPKAQAQPTRSPVGATTAAKLGRNDPCWCGSGKKYKNCHMHSDLGQSAPANMAGNGKRRR